MGRLGGSDRAHGAGARQPLRPPARRASVRRVRGKRLPVRATKAPRRQTLSSRAERPWMPQCRAPTLGWEVIPMASVKPIVLAAAGAKDAKDKERDVHVRTAIQPAAIDHARPP